MTTLKTASRADSLVEEFQDRIRSGALSPGARMPTEMEIAASYGVSRTVVREALARLGAMGLVVSRQGAGAFVAENARFEAFQVSPNELTEIDDVLKLLEMRVALETEMASLAAQRRTDADLADMAACLDRMANAASVEESVAADVAFHAAIAHASGNVYYARFMEFLGVRLVPSRKLALRGQSSTGQRAYARKINADHQAILDAIAAGDPSRARRAARKHMVQSLERHRRIQAEEAAAD